SDTKRQPYAPRCDKFLVSPLNAREQLAAFIKGAKQELLIYDSKISDRAMIFLGSQSLRELELDARREVGVILRDDKVVSALVRVFEEDWSSTIVSKAQPANLEVAPPVNKAAIKAAEVVAKELPRVAPVVEEVVQQIVGDETNVEID